MSLDVYLESDEPVPNTGSGIFVRRNGATVEITQAEWDDLHPGREPVQLVQQATTHQVYHANITGNLYAMAAEAGLADVLWRPEENGITKAHQMFEPLLAGLNRLLKEPERFKVLNPSNGWGSYELLVRFVCDYMLACTQHRDATVVA